MVQLYCGHITLWYNHTVDTFLYGTTILWTHYTMVQSYCGHITLIQQYCGHITLVQPYCGHITLGTTILWPHYTIVQPYCGHITLWYKHTVDTVSNFVYNFWTYFPMVKLKCSNFRIITSVFRVSEYFGILRYINFSVSILPVLFNSYGNMLR